VENLKSIEHKREVLGISWEELAAGLPISGNSLRTAFSRSSVKESYLNVIEENLKKNNSIANEPKTLYITKNKKLKEAITVIVSNQEEAVKDLLFNEFLEKLLYKKLNELKKSSSNKE